MIHFVFLDLIFFFYEVLGSSLIIQFSSRSLSTLKLHLGQVYQNNSLKCWREVNWMKCSFEDGSLNHFTEVLHFIFLLYCLRKMVQHQVKNFLSSLLVTIFLCFYAESLLTANKSIKCFLKNGCILYFVVILEKWKLTPPPTFYFFLLSQMFQDVHVTLHHYFLQHMAFGKLTDLISFNVFTGFRQVHHKKI